MELLHLRKCWIFNGYISSFTSIQVWNNPTGNSIFVIYTFGSSSSKESQSATVFFFFKSLHVLRGSPASFKLLSFLVLFWLTCCTVMCREFPMASFLQGNSCTFETPFFFLGDQAETKTPNGRPWQQQNIVMAYYALLFTAGLLLRLSVTRFSVAMVTLRPQNIQKRATTYAAALHNHPFEILLQDGFFLNLIYLFHCCRRCEEDTRWSKLHRFPMWELVYI